jgi:hypothetical protein
MPSKFALLLFSLLILTPSANPNSSVQGSSQDFSMCLADAIVLDSLFLRVCAEIASGVLIHHALNDLHYIWSLIPQWLQVCKGAVGLSADFSGKFPEIDIQMGVHGFEVNGQLVEPLNHLKDADIKDCLSGVKHVVELMYELKVAGEERQNQRILDLIFTLKDVAMEVAEVCKN